MWSKNNYTVETVTNDPINLPTPPFVWFLGQKLYFQLEAITLNIGFFAARFGGISIRMYLTYLIALHDKEVGLFRQMQHEWFLLD